MIVDLGVLWPGDWRRIGVKELLKEMVVAIQGDGKEVEIYCRVAVQRR